jgi:hypothetical protein
MEFNAQELNRLCGCAVECLLLNMCQNSSGASKWKMTKEPTLSHICENWLVLKIGLLLNAWKVNKNAQILVLLHCITWIDPNYYPGDQKQPKTGFIKYISGLNLFEFNPTWFSPPCDPEIPRLEIMGQVWQHCTTGKVTSVQEACANCFEVHISKFEAWKLNSSLFHFFMLCARFQPQNIWHNLLVLTWL